MGGASEVLAPFRESMYDCKELAIVDVIVSFGRGKGF